MNKSDSKIGFLRAEIAALEELMESTPRDHFLMREPLKDRKRELTMRLESLLSEVKAPAIIEKPPLIRAEKIEVSEIAMEGVLASAMKLREAQIQLELSRLQKIKRHEKLQKVEAYFGFFVSKLIGLVALLIGGMELLDPTITALEVKRPEVVFVLGFILVITPTILQVWADGIAARRTPKQTNTPNLNKT